MSPPRVICLTLGLSDTCQFIHICTTFTDIYARKKNIVAETYAEEMRVLYVAFTRAKEKLYMTGCVKDADKFKAACDMYIIGDRRTFFASAIDTLKILVIALGRAYKSEVIQGKHGVTVTSLVMAGVWLVGTPKLREKMRGAIDALGGQSYSIEDMSVEQTEEKNRLRVALGQYRRLQLAGIYQSEHHNPVFQMAQRMEYRCQKTGSSETCSGGCRNKGRT